MRPAVSRILIADDHQAMRQGVRSLLEAQPAYQVIAEAGDGREALDLARETKPDIAVLDYSLPVHQGQRVVEHCNVRFCLPRKALDLARETKPDIAVLDYSLPLMNGLELTRSIKHDLPRTEVLIYTMHDRESILIDVLRAGARGYVDTSKNRLLSA